MSDLFVSTLPTQTQTQTTEDRSQTNDVPIKVLESLLHDHVADHTAMITACTSTPFPNLGTNDSSTLYRVTFTWEFPTHPMLPETTTWLVKHWKTAGVRDRAFSIAEPREALAWEQGWLRPSALPAGLVVPIIGARRLPDNTQAWLAMADVSTELSAYPRMALSGAQALQRTQAILARLAHFHALWEQPDRQLELQAFSWLRRPEMFLWDMAPTFARALGRSPVVPVPPATHAPPVWSELSADLEAFLQGRPAHERNLWEHLLTDRQAVVEGLASYPQTLLHNDLDDRNIGLRWSNSKAGTESQTLDTPDLVLIDWEWMALGPAAIDVANLILRLPVMIAPGTSIPDAVWGYELADYYFEHYRAASGRCVDAASWRRSYGLAVVAQGVVQMPFLHGSLRRAIRGELPLPQIVGVPEAIVRQNLESGLPLMQKMEERVLDEAHRQQLHLLHTIEPASLRA